MYIHIRSYANYYILGNVLNKRGPTVLDQFPHPSAHNSGPIHIIHFTDYKPLFMQTLDSA